MAGEVAIDWYDGDRTDIRRLFELAEDSVVQLDSYLDAGRVLVARRDGAAVGHLQLVPTDVAGAIEIKNMAVLPELHGIGIGTRLVETALAAAAQEGYAVMVVATGGADTGNLRFYQRCGFRLRSVERDAFTPDKGYPEPIVIDGVVLRDRVWLDQPLGSSA